jgi:hypothetical protein
MGAKILIAKTGRNTILSGSIFRGVWEHICLVIKEEL